MSSPTGKQLAAMAETPAVARQSRKKLRKRVHANVVNDRDILGAMVAVGGVGKAASSYLGIPHRVLLNRIKKNPWLQDQLEVITEDRLDFAESKLLQLISEGNVHATLFYLRTVGKERGYTEHVQEIAVNTNVAVAVVPGLLDSKDWAALSKQYQQEKELEVNRQLRELEQQPAQRIEEPAEDADFTVVELFKAE